MELFLETDDCAQLTALTFLQTTSLRNQLRSQNFGNFLFKTPEHCIPICHRYSLLTHHK